MSKITLTDVKGGFNLTAIQSNFDALETELQGKVFYRNNPVGEPNTMETDMDMNNKRILNLPEPLSDNEPLRKRDAGSLSSLISSAAGYASTASIKAAEATASASSASGSAASATASANAASASAIAAAASAVAAEDSSRLTVGTTTTGAAGSSVSVTITGSPGAQALNLTIPRGDTGATGAAGAGITPQAVGFTVTGGTTPKTLTVALDANVSGTNTGDNAVNSLYSGLVTNATHTGDATGSGALTVVAINGTNMAGLATGVLKNTTGTGVPSIATAGTDYVLPGGALGTPSSGTLTSCTGLPVSTGISGFGTGVATFLATPSSANLAAALTDETGSGANVFATSPTLVTPLLGTPTSGNLSNCTADGTNSVGFRHVPQNSQSAAYTTVLTDAGKHILHPSADTTARTFTIDSNANVAYPIGTAITFVNQNAGGVVTIAITSDTMRLAGAGTTGSRTLAANGVATALKLTSTEWIISGTGLT